MCKRTPLKDTGQCWGNTWGVPSFHQCWALAKWTDHLPTTYRPLTDHLLTTYWLCTDHVLTTYRPPTDHLQTIYWPLTDHFFMVQLAHDYLTSWCKSSQSFWLCPTCVMFGHPLVLTCHDLCWALENSNASWLSTFFTIWSPNSSWHKLIISRLYIHAIYNFLGLTWTCTSQLANLHLVTHRKSVRKFWFCKVALTCESVCPGL